MANAPAPEAPEAREAAPAAAPDHSAAFRWRRFANWFPLGLAYAFLYMGRYNLTVAATELGQLMTKEDFGVIFGIGAGVYGFAFFFNGPLTDRIGGKRAMLIALLGAGLANIGLAVGIRYAASGHGTIHPRLLFTVLFAINMYFQSFGAVAIVKVNAHWFHVRERGGFSGIFGTMISSGIFLAFTVNKWVIDLVKGSGPARAENAQWAFIGPAALLLAMFVVELLLLRDRPSQAGHQDFDTGDASSGDAGGDVTVGMILRRILTNPVLLTIAGIELCTGVLRQGVMHWYPFYAKEILALPDTHSLRNGSWGRWPPIVAMFAAAALLFVIARRSAGRRRAILYVSAGLVFLAPFVQGGWGGILFVAGVVGGNVAGWVSDIFFHSRRAPAAGGLYFGLAVCAGLMYFGLGGTTTQVGWAAHDMEAAKQDLDQLRPGDLILAIAEREAPAGWRDVARALACYPAGCAAGARFDAASCACKGTRAGQVDAAPPWTTADGTIPAVVRRDGREITLRLRDPAGRRDAGKQAVTWTLRAGDVRKLKAGPVTTLSPLWLGLMVFFMSTCVIGTHGLLSGTATMDFGGRKGAATAVGLIDGAVYIGTMIQSVALGYLTTRNWAYWPLFLLPFALVGFYMTTRIWHARPGKGGGGH